MLSECAGCGEPLFEYMPRCSKCHKENPAYIDPEDPNSGAPWPERAAYGLGSAGLLAAGFLAMFVVVNAQQPLAMPGLVRDFVIGLVVGLAGILLPLKTDLVTFEGRGPVGRAVVVVILVLAAALLAFPVRWMTTGS